MSSTGFLSSKRSTSLFSSWLDQRLYALGCFFLTFAMRSWYSTLNQEILRGSAVSRTVLCDTHLVEVTIDTICSMVALLCHAAMKPLLRVPAS